MVIEHSIRCADDCLGRSKRIPRYADAGLNVVFVGLNSFLQTEQIVSRGCEPLRRFETRRNLDVVAHTIIQSEVLVNAPRVLPEGSDRNVAEGIARTADALNEISRQSGAVSLNRREIGEIRQAGRTGIYKAEAGCSESSEIVNAAVVDGESCGQRKVVEVGAEFCVVAADRPRKVVGELITLLDALDERVRLASEVCDACNVDGGIRSTWNLRVVEVRQTAARVLKAKL